MHADRRIVRLLVTGAVAVLATAACGAGGGQGSSAPPDSDECDLGTVRLLVSSAPGSPVDVMARRLVEALEATGFEPNVVVETKTGGSGAVAMSALVGAPADGRTLYAMTRSQPLLFASGQIDGFGPEEIEYLVRLQDDPYVWAVRADGPFTSMADLVGQAQEKPGEVTVGGFGSGSGDHLSALSVAQKAGIDVTWVPHEGGSEAVTAMLGGFIDVVNTGPGAVLEHVRAGDVRVLGIASAERAPGLPDSPTFQEAGVDFVGSHWRGVVARAGMPEACKTVLEGALTEAYEHELFQRLLTEQNINPGYMPSEEFADSVARDMEEAEELLREAGL